MPTIIAAVGDTHINSTLGLAKPIINLDDGGTYRTSKGQRWLWRNWLDYWNTVEELKEEHKAEVWTVLNGDMVDVNGKHIQTQNISSNEADVFKMTIDTLEPALDRSDKVFVVRGTAAHTNPSSSMEEKIAYDIGAEKCEDNYSWWELLLECEKVLFDIRHHGPLGFKEWTRGNALNSRAVELMLKYANKRCPDVALQSHKHRFSTSSDEYPIKIFALPAWQLITEFVHRINQIMPADVGGIIFICDNGRYQPIIKRYRPEIQRAWKNSQN